MMDGLGSEGSVTVLLGMDEFATGKTMIIGLLAAHGSLRKVSSTLSVSVARAQVLYLSASQERRHRAPE
jgi:hypothetical protein